MLQSIRDRARGWVAWVIVGAISVPFALWGINEYLSPTVTILVAQVNDVELRKEEFQRNFDQEMRRMRANFRGKDIDLSAMEPMIKQQILKQMVEDEVLRQSISTAGLRIGNAMLTAKIHSIPAFKQGGRFSPQLYNELLRREGLSPTRFEADVRNTLLTDQLRVGILESAFVTKSETEQYTRLKEQQRRVAYLSVSAGHFKDRVEVADEEVKTYFAEHSRNYSTPEKISIEYVELSQDSLTEQSVEEEVLRKYYEEQRVDFVTVPEWQAAHILIEEESSALQKAKDILARIKAGESFEDLAKEFSADTESAKNGGDLGTFGTGQMVKPFEKALKTMQAGSISEPVKTRFGYHIIKLIDAKPARTRSFEEVREELLLTYQAAQAETRFYALYDEFSNLAFEQPDNLDILAKRLGLEKKTTEMFERSGKKKGITANPKLLEAAFSVPVLQQGSNSEVIELGGRHLLVLRLKDHESAKPKSLEEVQESIIKKIKSDKAREAANDLGKALLAKLKENADPRALADEHALKWEKPRWVGRQDTGAPAGIVQEAFKLGHPQAGKTALYQGLSVNGDDYALVTVLEIKDGVPPEQKNGAEQKRQLRHQILGDSEYRLLVTELKNKADIETYENEL